MMVADTVKSLTGAPDSVLAPLVSVPVRTLVRWRGRARRGKALAEKPGPSKVGSFRFATLIRRILNLSHGRKRTRGAGALYAKYENKFSRRDFNALVEYVRWEVNKTTGAMARRITWNDPRLVWAMDDADVNHVGDGGHGHINVIHDLGSQYTLRVLGASCLADGWKIAATLEELFKQHGPPLVMKMDNGSNLNHHAVLSILDKYGVIPLNSPAHYPPYNGAIEHKQGEINDELYRWIGDDPVSER